MMSWKRLKWLKKIGCLLLSLLLLLLCSAVFAEEAAAGLQKDLVILFTSDVHCAVDRGWGYAGLYAMKEGLGNSDVATATLVWTNAIFTETTPETPTSAKAVQESIPVLISAKGGNISVKCEADGQEVNVYTIYGLSLGAATVKNGEALISTSIPSGDIAVVKVGGRSVKVIMR